MSEIKQFFGTDGIRGRVGVHPINAEFVLKLGWAVGKYFSNKGPAKILIGKDTRVSGYMFESALEAGLTAAGANTKLLGPMPTPAIAYLTRTLRAQAGIVISASHNGYEDNGIKFFCEDGFKLPDEVEMAIEAEIAKSMETVASKHLGKATRIQDAPGRYIEFCKSTIGTKFRLSGLKVVIDCAHGATYHIAPAVFTELGAQVTVIGASPDGFNINDGYGSMHIEKLQAKVLELNADIGIAFDGDGDRVLMVTNEGQCIDGDDILYIIAKERLARNNLSAGVVGTVMTNLGLEIAFKELGLKFIRTAVGDRYVLAELLKQSWELGGEASGHIINLDLNTTGDGIISALQVLKALSLTDKSLADLCHDYEKFPQKLINIKFSGQKNPLDNDNVKAIIKDAESQLGNKGRVLVRLSGTEPLVRVMVEGEASHQVDKVANQIAQVIQGQIK